MCGSTDVLKTTSKDLRIVGLCSQAFLPVRDVIERTSRKIALAQCTTYIPGIFIPAMRRAKLGLPICLNIFFIWAYWRRRLLTSCTLVPLPRAMRLRRFSLMTSWWSRLCAVIGAIMGFARGGFFFSIL